jgi:hypothetical protein
MPLGAVTQNDWEALGNDVGFQQVVCTCMHAYILRLTSAQVCLSLLQQAQLPVPPSQLVLSLQAARSPCSSEHATS